MNGHNLIRKEDRTPEERRESARKAGKASGEARRKKRDARSAMKMILSLMPGLEDWNALSMAGVKPEQIDNKTLLLMELFVKAKSGDVRAIETVLRISGDISSLDEKEQKVRIKKLEAEVERLEAEVRRMNGDTGAALAKAEELLGGLPDGLDG